MWCSGPINNVIKRGTDAYRRSLTHLTGLKIAVVLMFVIGLGATFWMYRSVPTSFVPDEDQGYFITIVQAPEGASLEYTTNVCRKAAQIIAQNKDAIGVFSVPGFSFSGAAPNRGIIFANLRPQAERKGKEHSAQSIIADVRGPLMGITDALVLPFLPPPIQGLGQYGGFHVRIVADGIAATWKIWKSVLHEIVAKGNQQPELRGLFTSFSARDPQFEVTIDREKAKSLGVPFSADHIDACRSSWARNT